MMIVSLMQNCVTQFSKPRKHQQHCKTEEMPIKRNNKKENTYGWLTSIEIAHESIDYGTRVAIQ